MSSIESKENTEQTSLKVVIRVRPLNQKEIEANRQIIWTIDHQNNFIYSTNQSSSKKYSFDRVYAPHHTTKDIYNDSVSQVIHSFMDGFNGTIFAYGQTSSGKTYTMMGSGNGKDDGIIHRAIKFIFRSLAKQTDREFNLNVSYLEIYNESVKDLLSPNNINLKISMDNFHRPIVSGLTTESITHTNNIFEILKHGMSNRNIGATKMNDQSSRSHTIFKIQLESRKKNTTNCEDYDGAVLSSILNIVDLAGSERAKKTDASGMRLKEGGHINKSLLTLGIVIKKLSEISTKNQNEHMLPHIPYRDSKLTHILEPALGGNSKTVVICTITPADVHVEESVSTLGFASRAKEVKNCATVTEIIDDAVVIKRQKHYIQELQRQLTQCSGGKGDNIIMIKHNDNHNNNSDFAAERAKYEREIRHLKAICMNPCLVNDNSNMDMKEEEDNNNNNNMRKKNSVLGKRRRHSVAIELNGSPARKRMKTQIIQNLPHRTRHSSFSTPMNKIKCENEVIACKLRKATHISKSLQQELNAKHKDFHSMQTEIDRLSEENKIFAQMIEINNNDRDVLMENQQLSIKINELNNELLTYKQKEECDAADKLNRELEESRVTIDQLQQQIQELRLNIEQQNKITESFRASSLETSVDNSTCPPNNNNNVLLQMNLHKLQSKLILIKNDRLSINQIFENEKTKFISFKNEYEKKLIFYNDFVKNKLTLLQHKLDESADEKRLFESQYHQIREERDELRDELETLRRPENEIIEELQSELLTMKQQTDIDTNHTNNTQTELENKLIEIENLKEFNKELNKSITEREEKIIAQYNVKINDLKCEINNVKQLNEKLELDMINTNKSYNSVSLNKIDAMNNSQLKDLYRNTKRSLRELQSKMSSIERKKAVHEKTAQKYTKRCNDLEQRLKLSLREHNNTKTELLSINKENKSLKYKNEKLCKDIKKQQDDSVNNKDLNRKLNLTIKRLESVQKKHDIKTKELLILKQEKAKNLKEINEIKENLNNLNSENKKLKKNISNLENNICQLINEKENILTQLKTEKDVVKMLQNELKKFHQLNGKQSVTINELNNELNLKKNSIQKINDTIGELNEKINELNNDINDRDNKLRERENEFITQKEKFEDILHQNESLNLSLSTMKEMDLMKRNEIDETNKMLRELQIELKENKKELIEYQNRWQNERKENDNSIEKLRVFELKTNNLLHENQMNKTSLESKMKEIDRLNTEFKAQQENLLKTISLNADIKIQLEGNKNEIENLKQENELIFNEKERLIKNNENTNENLTEIKNKNMFLSNKILKYENEMATNQNNLNNKINELNSEINEYKNKFELINKKNDECKKKYEILKKKKNITVSDLDDRENEILNLNDKIEDLHIEFEKVIKDLNYKLNKKISDLNESEKNFCDLETEFEEITKLKKEEHAIFNKIEMEYNELIQKSEKCEAELKLKTEKLNKMNENLKKTMNKLQEITLQNEKLRDDSSNDNIFEKKYSKAKDLLSIQNQNIEIQKKNQQTLEKKLLRMKQREEQYETAVNEWKKHCDDLKNKINRQDQELKNLRPSKAKARKFEQLCKEYHIAKTNQFKAKLICRETQTYECKLPTYNNENKENSNNMNE